MERNWKTTRRGFLSGLGGAILLDGMVKSLKHLNTTQQTLNEALNQTEIRIDPSNSQPNLKVEAEQSLEQSFRSLGEGVAGLALTNGALVIVEFLEQRIPTQSQISQIDRNDQIDDPQSV